MTAERKAEIHAAFAANLVELREFMAEHAAPKFTHSQSVPADNNGPACDFYTINPS